MITVGAPNTIGAPHPARSPILAAGRPPISTVVEPPTIVLGGCGPPGGGMLHTCGVPRVAAGPGDQAAPADAPGAAVHDVVGARGGSVLTVVETAQDVGAVEVALLEADEHLVADLREDHRAAVLPGAQLHRARPPAAVAL